MIHNKLRETELGKVENAFGVHCLDCPEHERDTEAHHSCCCEKQLQEFASEDLTWRVQHVVDVSDDKKDAQRSMKNKTPASHMLDVPQKRVGRVFMDEMEAVYVCNSKHTDNV